MSAQKAKNKPIRRLFGGAIGLPRPIKQAVMVVFDVIGLPLALLLAFAIKSDSLTFGFGRNPLLYLGVIAASIPVFALLGLYRSVVRYIGPRATTAILSGVTMSAVALLLMSRTVAWQPIPVTLVAIYWLLALFWVGGTRYLARWMLAPTHPHGEPVIIYGAGEAGARLAVALLSDTSLYPVAYVDEKTALHGTLVQGIPVVAPADLGPLVDRFGVKRVLLAVPAASRRRRAQILKGLEALGLHVQSVPNLEDIVTGRARVSDLREIDLADVLGRDPVPPDQRLFDACIRGKSVMVTGAGGSIGSELCRQIIGLGPARLVLFEMSEIALYTIERELRTELARTGAQVELNALLGNAHHKYRMREVIQAFGIQTLYHAAAYKHVPIVEENMVEGVHNNVYSTWHAAEAALESGVEAFVLISTDKAVNPTNVMGATKRFAEIVLQALQTQTSRTRFCMVRFGNVLGSSGSVVPLFQEQIRAGGPVTVTHPDVRRYFMTIPEAAQLVLQAGSMGQGGDVFVLDMGQPVKIDELARRMIALTGLSVRDEAHPEGDIEIRYTGLRPAEKLYEELLIGNNVTGTEHPMIMRAIEHAPAWPEVKALLAELTIALNQFDCKRLIGVLERAVREYQTAPDVHDLVWSRRPPVPAAAEPAKVTVLAEHRGQKVPPVVG
jgi:FlaA1/EpsC-like NDP-sugar epimerase